MGLAQWRNPSPRGAVALVVGMVLTGCAAATTANYDRMLDSWVNVPAENLVRSWGAPTSKLRLTGGDEVYVYERRSSEQLPIPTETLGSRSTYWPGATTATGGRPLTVERWCRTEFDVDQTGRIVRWRHEGNDCVARSPN